MTDDSGIILPQCNDCAHLRRDERQPRCDAFPGGIPEPIFNNRFDHHEAYPGDNGIRFAPIGLADRS